MNTDLKEHIKRQLRTIVDTLKEYNEYNIAFELELLIKKMNKEE